MDERSLHLPPQGVAEGTPGALSAWSQEVAQTVNRILQGRTNNTGMAVLLPGSATTIADDRVGPGSLVLFMADSADAAALVAGGLHVEARAVGSFTLRHPTLSASLSLAYAVIG